MSRIPEEDLYLIESRSCEGPGPMFRISELETSYTVGRGEDCQFRVKNCDISRRHLELMNSYHTDS